MNQNPEINPPPKPQIPTVVDIDLKLPAGCLETRFIITKPTKNLASLSRRNPALSLHLPLPQPKFSAATTPSFPESDDYLLTLWTPTPPPPSAFSFANIRSGIRRFLCAAIENPNTTTSDLKETSISFSSSAIYLVFLFWNLLGFSIKKIIMKKNWKACLSTVIS